MSARLNGGAVVYPSHPLWALQLTPLSAVRVVILTGNEKSFSTGMDLGVFQDMDALAKKETCPGRVRESLVHIIQWLQDAISGPEKCVVPVIAAISGHCIGGAVDLATACDLRYCTDDATFSIKETDLAMVADIGTLQRLPKLIPMAVVKELAYTGRRMGAEQALQHGLVNQVLPDAASALDAAMKVAHEIASKPPIAIAGTKQALHYARDHSTEDALKQMGWLQSGIWSNRHVQEAIAAFQTKRTGHYPELAELKSFKD